MSKHGQQQAPARRFSRRAWIGIALGAGAVLVGERWWSERAMPDGTHGGCAWQTPAIGGHVRQLNRGSGNS